MLQNSQENNCVRVPFLMKLQALKPYIEKCASEKTLVLACFISGDY